MFALGCGVPRPTPTAYIHEVNVCSWDLCQHDSTKHKVTAHSTSHFSANCVAWQVPKGCQMALALDGARADVSLLRAALSADCVAWQVPEG
jgi:hypothetical protein